MMILHVSKPRSRFTQAIKIDCVGREEKLSVHLYNVSVEYQAAYHPSSNC